METIQIAEQPVPALTYKSDELDRIISILRHCTEPEEIILFGSLAGATPFSQITAYDLFVVTGNRPSKDWLQISSFLKLEFPTRSRAIPFVNFYICPPPEISGNNMGALYRFVRSEGKAVYSRRTFKNRDCDYEKIYFAANDLYEHYFNQAEGLLESASNGIGVFDLRQGAFCLAYAVELMLRALHAAFHISDTDLHLLSQLFLRLRTLSTELYILLDPERAGVSRMLGRLEGYRSVTLYSPNSPMDRDEIEEYYTRTHKMQEIIEKLCTARLELYKSRITPTA